MGYNQAASFSDYTGYIGSLLNLPYSSMPTSQQTAVQNFFNFNAQKIWERCNWMEVCPYGEARFAGNLGQYPNDLSQTSYWTATALTPTANALANPADGRVTATKLLETSATSAHKMSQSITFIPNATYQVTCYFRPILGRYLYLSANDGVNTYYSFFSPAGVVGTYSNNLSSPPTVTQANNGYWICTIYFTTASNADGGTFGPGLSTDGSTLSYAGDTTKGAYVWGNVINQTTFVNPLAQVVSWSQLGESKIEQVFNVWRQSPYGAGYPVTAPYEETPDGIQTLGTNGWAWNGWLYTYPSWYNGSYPVYLYYRKQIPTFAGNAYSSGSSYAVDTTVLYTDANSVMNWWKCVSATSAGQSPDTNPTKWEVQTLPGNFLKFVSYAALADFYRMDGQPQKAQDADRLADEMFMLEADKLERQSGWLPPMKVSNSVTSQPRGLVR